jgi:hypothetical protein
VADTDSVGTGTSTDGNVIDGTGTDGGTAGPGVDTPGADGASISNLVGYNGSTDANASDGLDVNGQFGTLHMDADGTYTYTRTSGSAGEDTFTYTLKDGDGDTDTATLKISLADTGKVIVGSNADDFGDPNDSDPNNNHIVPNGPAGTDGAINGTGGNDTIMGDPGGITLTSGDKANIVLVLDVSQSMTTSIPFGTGHEARIEAMEDAVKTLLQQLSASGADDVRVHIVTFGLDATTVGTYDLRVDGESQPVTNGMLNTIENLSNNLEPGTNYEAGLYSAYQWINGDKSTDPLADANVNKVLFISDGEPNAWMTHTTTDGDHGPSNSPVSQNFNQTALDNVTGTAGGSGSSRDSTDERAMIETHPDFTQNPFSIEAIGISLSGQALTRLGVVEGDDGSATSINTAEELNSAVGALAGGSEIPTIAGSDVINAGAGNDIVMGDVPFTNDLATAAGLSTDPGSGWKVFQLLEGTTTAFTTSHDPAGDGAIWTRADTIAYIQSHAFQMAEESGRSGGNDTITAGSGDDVVFGQEGDDTINFAVATDGRDFVDGGSGTDTFKLDITGATGAIHVETVAAWEARTHQTYDLTDAPELAGTDVASSGIDSGEIILVSDDAGNIVTEMVGIEEIDVTGGSGDDTIVVDGSFTGTSLSPSTIHFEGLGGDDTLDLTGRESGHRVVADGGDNTAAGDTVKVDFTSADITGVHDIAGGYEVSHGGITDTFTNFENIVFQGGGSQAIADVLGSWNTAPVAGDINVITNIVDGSPIVIPDAALLLSATDADGDALSVTGAGGASGGTADHSANGVTFTPSLETTDGVEHVYNFVGKTAGVGPNSAYYFEVDPSSSNEGNINALTALREGNPGFGDLTEAVYSSIASSDNTRWTTNDPGNNSSGDHAVFWAQFEVAQPASSITQLNVQIEGRQSGDPSSSEDGHFGIWNYSTGQWDSLEVAHAKGSDTTWNGTISSNVADYLDDSTNQVTIAVYNEDVGEPLQIDYVELKVTSNDQTPFTSGSFDYTVNDGTASDTGHVSITGVGGSTLSGTAGNDMLIAGSGDDILDGGSGSDTMIGGAGADTFVIGSDSGIGSIQDFITDYSGTGRDGDAIDLTHLLSGLASNTDLAGDGYVHLLQDGSNVDVQVDANGNGDSLHTVAVLENYHFDSGSEAVKILFKDTNGTTHSQSIDQSNHAV